MNDSINLIIAIIYAILLGSIALGVFYVTGCLLYKKQNLYGKKKRHLRIVKDDDDRSAK